MAEVLGVECKAYRNSGTYASPTWDEMISLRDVTLTFDSVSVDASVRASGSWELIKVAFLKAEVELEFLYSAGDADREALITAYLAKTSLDLLFLDGEEGSTNKGLRAHFAITKWTREEPLKDLLKSKFTIAPTYNTAGTAGALVNPSWGAL